MSFPIRLLLLLLACTCPDALGTAGERPPSIVLVFVDDMGWGDLSCQGETRWRTPRLDALAEQGTRFSRFYVAQPVCSASRAALLTGCYPNRLGIHGALGPSARHGLSHDETTLAELCRSRGYATAVHGKWHLGSLPTFLPMEHGFDEWFGIPYSNDMWPGHPENPKPWGDLPSFENEAVVAWNDQGRITREITARSIDFIERAVARDQPFFVYVAHPMPHVPLHVSAPGRGASGAGLYGDVIVEIDTGVGEILDALDRLGVADDTLVLFTSDNGPWLSYGDHAGTTAGLREGKGTTFEGGVRVPAIARWPGRIPAGRVCDTPLMTIDVLPTIAGRIGAELPALPIDGRDAWPVFAGEAGADTPHDSYALYYHQGALQALVAGRWKLHLPHGFRTMVGREPGAGGRPGTYDYGATIGLALFDLETDPYETTDVQHAHPDVLATLLDEAERWRVELGDSLTGRTGSGVRAPGRVAEDDGG